MSANTSTRRTFLKQFAVDLDPCNLVNCPERFFRNTDLLNDCSDKLAPRIAGCHAIDGNWNVGMQPHFEEVIIGQGSLDYATCLKRLAALPGDVPLMIGQETSAGGYDDCRRRLFEVGRGGGVEFG